MGKKNLVGVDIGSYYTKIVELEEKGDVLAIKKIVKERTPENIFDKEELDKDILSEFLKTIFSDYKIKNRNVAVALSSSFIITKTVSMPLVVDEEIEQAVMWEAEQYAPFGIDQVNVSYQILKKDKEKNEMIILIVLVRKDIVESYADALSKARLKVRVVDVDVFAMANAFFENEPDIKRSHSLLVDVGHNSTKLIFIRDEIPTFSRYVEFGFGPLLEEASETLEIPLNEVVRVIEDLSHIDQERSAPVVAFLKDKLNRLYAQIESSVSFYQTNVLDVEDDITNILFSGALGALFPYIQDGMPEYMIEKNTKRLNPFGAFVAEGIESKDVASESSSLYSVALGLAVRKA